MSERQRGLRKRTRPFTPVPNETVEDWTLSYRALGLLTRILRMPDGFVIRSEQLSNEGQGKTRNGRPANREGREAVRTTLRELARGGYYRLGRCRMQDGTFEMQTDAAEDSVPAWAEQARVFGAKPVPMVEQEDGTFMVRYPDGTLLPDDFEPPTSQPDTTDSEDVVTETPKTGFRAPGNRSPGNQAPGKAEPGSCGPLSKRVTQDGQQDSVPASQVRRGNDVEADSGAEGQMLLGGGVETLTKDKAPPTFNDVAMGIARSWLTKREEFNCPVVVRGKTDPIMAVRAVVLPALEAQYTEFEIKYALMRVDRAIPTPNALDTALAEVRRGWRPNRDWAPGEARSFAAAGRQRQGTSAMAGTNLHVDDLSADQRRADNPFSKAARQSDYLETTQGAPA
jgi:hypothetical protein